MHIIDGITGFVGANLAHALLVAGEEVVGLARQPGRVVRQRVSEAAIARGDLDTSALRVLRWSLEEPALGLAPATLRSVFSQPCDYWHLAAAITFAPGNRDELTRTNVGGTERALETFQRYAPEGSRFFLVSSVYSAGLSAPGEHVAEEWHPAAEPSAFRNFYEYTKRAAENVFRRRHETDGVPGAVLRLGQVVGDAETGRASTDYGLYDYLRAIATITRKRPDQHLRIVGEPAADLHMVPIDACVRWMAGAVDRTPHELQPPIVHVLDRLAVPAQRVADAFAAHLPVTLTVTPATDFAAEPMTHLERVLEARMTYTGRYLTHSMSFGRDHLVGLDLDEPPTLPDEVLDRLVGEFVRRLDATDAVPAPAREVT